MSKTVYSSSVGKPWQGPIKPDSRRKVNLDKKSKKGGFKSPWNKEEDDEPVFDKSTGGKMKNKKDFAEFNYS